MIEPFHASGATRIAGLALGVSLAAAAIAAPASAEADCTDGMIPVGDDCAGVDQLASEITGIVEKATRDFDLTAVIVDVRVGDAQVIRQAFGTSMAGIPATPDMHFRNGSVAMAYLSTVLLRLVEEGTLSLDDTVSKWFPDYPKADAVTLRMLISTTSGYADYVNLDYLPLYEDPFRQYTPGELIDIGLSQPMVCDPGTCFAYAHTNFVILGEILAKATGRPTAELIKGYILDPLGLENTRSEDTPVIQQPVLQAYTGERGMVEDSTYWNPSWTLARGAIMTTDIDDLMATGIAIGEGSLLSDASHALQLGPETAAMKPFNDTVYYAMGLVVNNGWVMQNPMFAGYSAAFATLPERGIAIAVAATSGGRTPDDARPHEVLWTGIASLLAP
ncbi:MAG: beta-lactamase family protein, partial [Bauldia sp.]|uniref:serine hydrolase domain-containing protein n=1 Tax=Bauldia sp. TaxID=2575872 RepID=UPI001D260F5D